MAFFRGPNIIRDGLVLALDAGSERSYPGSGTTWYDLSGNNNHATIYNSPTYNNGRFTFVPSNYIRFPNPILNQPTLEQEWTVTAYVNIDTTGSQQLIADGNLNRGLYLHAWTTNAMILYLNGGANDYYKYSTYNADVWLLNQGWKYVEFKFQNSSATRNMYVNLVNHTGSGPNATSTPSGNTSLWNAFVGVNGIISTLTIYNRMLSSTESYQNYNAQKSRFGL